MIPEDSTAPPAPAADAPRPAAFAPFVPPADLAEPNEKKDKKKDDDDDGKLGSKRGIETLFRTQYPMHMDLSSLADSKSNIMISINGLMVSILLGSLSSKIDSNPLLFVPTTVLTLGCLVSLIFAVLAAMPRVTTGTLTLDQARRDKMNLLFFGNYTRMSRKEYLEGMTELVQQKSDLYTSMMEDIYSLGGVLQRKFSLLRISYFAFVAGLVLGVVLYIAMFFYITVSPDVVAVPGGGPF